MKQVEIATDAASRLREASRMGIPLSTVQAWLEVLETFPTELRNDLPICEWLVVHSPLTSHQVRSMMALYSPFWPEFSGSPSSPVPHDDLGPRKAILQAHKWQGEYGEARRRLLRFIIETLKADLEHQACLNSDKGAP